MIVQGSKVVFQVLIGDEYRTLFCGKSINLRTQTDVVETTTKGDGRFKDYDYDQLSATVSIDAVTAIQNEENPPTLIDFWSYQYQFMEVNFRIIYTDATDPDRIKVFRAQGIVVSNSTNASAGLIVDGVADIMIKGEWFLEDAVPEYVNFQMLALGGEGGFSQIHVQLVDENGDIIFDTAQLPEAVSGWLEGNFNITKPVLVGNYYMILEVRTETENNTWLIAPPPAGLTGDFDEGINVINTFDPNGYTAFDTNRQLTVLLGTIVEPPPCVEPDFSGSTVLPDGEVGIPYAALFPLTGSPAFTLSDVTKPAWMNIAIVDISGTEKGVQFSGTPDAEGTDIDVVFQVNNNCGAVNVPQTINITAPPITQATVNWSFTEQGAANGNFRIYVNSVEQVHASNTDTGSINVNPGDNVAASLVVNPSFDSTMAVEDETAAVVIYFDAGPDANKNFNWNAESGHTYEIISDVGV